MELTKDNFNEVLQNELPVVVDFWASWCGPCQMMKPIFEEVEKEFEGKAVFGKLSTEDHPEVAGQFGVRSIPTFVIFHKGKEVDRLVGAAPKEAFAKQINQIIEKL